MTPDLALPELRRRGVGLFLDGGRLRYRAEAGVVTEQTKAYLRRHKGELIALLEAEGAIEGAMAAFDAELVRCEVCAFERNPEIATCPTCQPANSLPCGCLAPRVCEVAGPCERHAAGGACEVTGGACGETYEGDREQLMAGTGQRRCPSCRPPAPTQETTDRKESRDDG